ncbi:galactose-specific lectin nattectin-like [Cheilinus undulatus]|uniref:galactose-specific lectin nattectin-like n=1 Tax=Cheilinus undulatus TaxID=241271 RepID=UPI001BD4E853|nr:galactose-specific lectin nattectin-like [Cheilinus undulatus]
MIVFSFISILLLAATHLSIEAFSAETPRRSEGKDSAERQRNGYCLMCPPDWIQFERNCYKFNFSRLDWADSERACTGIGANLASVHTKEEYDFLRDTIHQVTGQHTTAWLGGYDATKEGVWLWSDGSHFDFRYWGPGEPNNVEKGTEHCMQMNFRGLNYVNDIPCNFLLASICKKRMEQCVCFR